MKGLASTTMTPKYIMSCYFPRSCCYSDKVNWIGDFCDIHRMELEVVCLRVLFVYSEVLWFS